MNKTLHSIIRARQRGVKEASIDLILSIGKMVRKPGNACQYFVGRRERQEAVEFLKQCIQELDKLVGKAIVVAEDGTILTTYHKVE